MTDTWVYESPDKGKTIFRRKFGAPHDTREQIKPKPMRIKHGESIIHSATECIKDGDFIEVLDHGCYHHLKKPACS